LFFGFFFFNLELKICPRYELGVVEFSDGGRVSRNNGFFSSREKTIFEKFGITLEAVSYSKQKTVDFGEEKKIIVEIILESNWRKTRF